jgi:hypothetical protein
VATSVTTTEGVLIVVKDSDATHSDPVKNLRGCYKRGDPVQVLPGTTPIVLPPAPPFFIVRITNVTLAQAIKFQNAQLDTVDPLHPVRVRRRLYACEVDNLSTPLRNELLADRYIEVSLNQIRNQLRNKQTGTTE